MILKDRNRSVAFVQKRHGSIRASVLSKPHEACHLNFLFNSLYRDRIQRSNFHAFLHSSGALSFTNSALAPAVLSALFVCAFASGWSSCFHFAAILLLIHLVIKGGSIVRRLDIIELKRNISHGGAAVKVIHIDSSMTSHLLENAFDEFQLAAILIGVVANILGLGMKERSILSGLCFFDSFFIGNLFDSFFIGNLFESHFFFFCSFFPVERFTKIIKNRVHGRGE